MGDVPILCIVAAGSGTGKTTFMEKLIKEMVQRGYRVGTVKSDSHGFEMDVPGKDTWRFAQAGAKATAIIGPNKFALIQQTEYRQELDDVVKMIQDVDIIFVEGYKMSARPRIEVVRREKGEHFISPIENLVAIVTDVAELSAPVPILDLEDIKGTADLIERKYLVKGK